VVGASVGDVAQSTLAREPELALGTTSAEAKAAGKSHVFSSTQPAALPTSTLK